MHLMFDQSVIFFVLIIHKTSLNPSLFIEMSVSSRTNGRSCIGVLGVSILPLSTIYLLDFRTVTVWCVLLFIVHMYLCVRGIDFASFYDLSIRF